MIIDKLIMDNSSVYYCSGFLDFTGKLESIRKLKALPYIQMYKCTQINRG